MGKLWCPIGPQYLGKHPLFLRKIDFYGRRFSPNICSFREINEIYVVAD